MDLSPGTRSRPDRAPPDCTLKTTFESDPLIEVTIRLFLNLFIDAKQVGACFGGDVYRPAVALAYRSRAAFAREKIFFNVAPSRSSRAFRKRPKSSKN